MCRQAAEKFFAYKQAVPHAKWWGHDIFFAFRKCPNSNVLENHLSKQIIDNSNDTLFIT